MTKERLEEIRKQKGTVYTVFDGDKEATALVLDEKCNDNNILAQAYFCLSNLFETKEQAEWHDKTYAERTERFEPPMWEDIKDEWNFYFMKMGIPHHFGIEKSNNIYISKCEYSCEYMSGGYEVLYNTEATKENYEKACGIVRGLFDGKRNDCH